MGSQESDMTGWLKNSNNNGYNTPLIARASLVTQTVKNLPEMQKTWVRSLNQEDALEKGMATHSSILAWRIPWTEEPGGLQSMRSQRDGHDWAINTHTEVSWDISNTASGPGKSRWMSKGNPEEMPHKTDSNYPEATTLSLWSCPCVYPHALFFFQINSLLVSLFSIFVGILRVRALSLTTGVARIWCSYPCDQTLISVQELKPCFKLL